MQAIEMKSQITETHEIHLKLPDKVKSGPVKVIIMYEEEQNITSLPKKRQFGQFRNQIKIHNNFDAPLEDTFWTDGE